MSSISEAQIDTDIQCKQCQTVQLNVQKSNQSFKMNLYKSNLAAHIQS